MAAACREGAQAAVWMGVPGRHGGWSWAPLMGPAGRDPNVQGSSGPRGQAQRGQQGRAERSAEDPEPQRNNKWEPAHHWSHPIRERPVCLRIRRASGRAKACGSGGGGGLPAQRGWGAHGEIMAPPTPPTRPDAQPAGVRTALRASGACGRETQALYLAGSGSLLAVLANSGKPCSDWTLEAGDT